MNPLFDRRLFVPDGEAHVMPDGRLYVYGSLDRSGAAAYCSGQYHVLSTDDPQLEHWVDHGVSFEASPQCLGPLYQPDTVLYAPDALYRNGRYYLYYCTSTGAEGVAEAASPAGPFGGSRPVTGASGTGIDPAVFMDDDGSVYYLWGQFRLHGARLKEDMCSIDEATHVPELLTEEEHGFHEGASLRKRNGKYYLLYTSTRRGSARCLAYAMADHPLGPYHECGVVVDNTGCDPASWNDHGSMECFRGQWYVFYHRSSQNSMFSRRLCAEKIFFDADGRIAEVRMTTGGAAGAPDACRWLDGGRASRVGGGYIRPDDGGVEKLTGFPAAAESVWPSWAEFHTLQFGDGVGSVQAEVRGRGRLVFLVENAQVLATLPVDQAEFAVCRAAVRPVQGEHTLWVRFEGKGLELRRFAFARHTEEA